MQQEQIKVTTKKLWLIVVVMFGFGFVLVPIYDVFCDITGLNGKTGRIDAKDARSTLSDEQRIVTVEFDTNVNEQLPWSFKAKSFKLTVKPGMISEALFVVKNKANRAIIGKAVPSVAPPKASIYFSKTECFCFTEQTLEANEEKEMLVRFVVDKKLPEDVKTLTLSYTFFLAPGKKDVATTN